MFLGVVFITFNLRAPITAVGSVVDMISSEYRLTSAESGFITTLPLIAFALVSPFVSKLSKHVGYGKTMAIGLLLILLGELVRSYTNNIGLFVGTAFLGIGIAIGNVLIPSIIKMKFPNSVGGMISVYTTCLCIFAAIGAGVSVPLAKGLDLGWRNSLASWIILCLVSLAIWLPQLKFKPSSRPVAATRLESSPEKKSMSIWKSSTAWWVTLFMGTQSLLFYSLVAWLPTIIISKGMGDSFAGSAALTYQLLAIPATLMIPILHNKFKNQRGLVFSICLTYILGVLGLLITSTPICILLSCVLMSLAMGGSISLSIIFISLRSPNAMRTAELSGMSQSAGYLLAALGPVLMGGVFDIFHTWTIAMIIFCVLILFLAFCGWFAGNNVLIEE